MSFLKNLFSTDRERSAFSVFENMSEEQLEAHMAIDTYNDLQLTDAVRPVPNSPIRTGYRFDTFTDTQGKKDIQVPVIMAAASRDSLFDLFHELVEPLGEDVAVVLESSHSSNDGHVNVCCEEQENAIVRSHLWDYADPLLNDGCTGIAVVQSHGQLVEVVLDEHKLLMIYGMRGELNAQFLHILGRYGLRYNKKQPFITDAVHIHQSKPEYEDEFKKLLRLFSGDGELDDGLAYT